MMMCRQNTITLALLLLALLPLLSSSRQLLRIAPPSLQANNNKKKRWLESHYANSPEEKNGISPWEMLHENGHAAKTTKGPKGYKHAHYYPGAYHHYPKESYHYDDYSKDNYDDESYHHYEDSKDNESYHHYDDSKDESYEEPHFLHDDYSKDNYDSESYDHDEYSKDGYGSESYHHAYDESYEEVSKETSHDPYAWYDMDSSDEDAWGEYIAGYPSAKEPSKHYYYDDPYPWYDEPYPWYDEPYQKGIKGEKGPKAGKHSKHTKAPKGRAPTKYPTKHPEPDGSYHYEPMTYKPQPTKNDEYESRDYGYSKDEDGSDDVSKKQVTVPLELKYHVKYAREPYHAELYTITAQTDVFVGTFLDKFFDEYIHDMELDYFVLVPTEGLDPIVDGYAITLDYRGVTFFETEYMPSVSDMAAILEEAFERENLQEYLKRLHALPNESIFSSTTDVTIFTYVPDDESKLLKTLEAEAVQSSTSSSSDRPSSKVSVIALVSMVAAAAMATLAVAFVVIRKKRKPQNDDDQSFVESVFLGDQGCLVEKEIGDEEFEVTSVGSNNNTTRAENFLRLVARDEDDDYSGTGSSGSTFRIEMGGNKSFSRA